jgi:hypothetical protein
MINKSSFTHTGYLGLEQYFSHPRQLAYCFPFTTYKHEIEIGEGEKLGKANHLDQLINLAT